MIKIGQVKRFGNHLYEALHKYKTLRAAQNKREEYVNAGFHVILGADEEAYVVWVSNHAILLRSELGV